MNERTEGFKTLLIQVDNRSKGASRTLDPGSP